VPIEVTACSRLGDYDTLDGDVPRLGDPVLKADVLYELLKDFL